MKKCLKQPQQISCVIKLPNRFFVAICLFGNRSQTTTKCGQGKKVANKVQPGVSLDIQSCSYCILTSLVI